MPPPEADKSRGSLLAMILAGLFATAAGVVLFFLTLGAAGMILAIAAAVFGLIAIQYLVWGWWLGDMIRADAAEDDADDTRESSE